MKTGNQSADSMSPNEMVAYLTERFTEEHPSGGYWDFCDWFNGAVVRPLPRKHLQKKRKVVIVARALVGLPAGDMCRGWSAARTRFDQPPMSGSKDVFEGAP